MGVLSDRMLAAKINASPKLATDVDASDIGRRESQIQPASLDLSIGKIFVPGTSKGSIGSYENPHEELSLEQGRTAVLETNEELELPDNIAAIGFPPSTVSLKGVLMTNPGHIDPGYKGHMSFTVINMGRKPFHLKKGSPIVTLIFLDMAQSPKVSYSGLRKTTDGPSSGINEELMHRLSADFLDIEDRASLIAKREINAAQLRAPIITAIVTAVVTAFGTYTVSLTEPWKDAVAEAKSDVSMVNQDVADINARLNALGADINLGTVIERLDQIEKRLPTQQ